MLSPLLVSGDIGFATFTYLSEVASWDGSQSQLLQMRCDMVVEYLQRV